MSDKYSLQEMMDSIKAMVEEFYLDNQNPDFDMTPVVLTERGDEVKIHILIEDIHPLEAAHAIVEQGDLDKIAIAMPVWTKDPQHTDIRTGEAVMVLAQTETEQIMCWYDVTRELVPVLKERMSSEDPQHIESRVPLLYKGS